MMVTVTGERVTTAAAGFGPTWQRHVAAYDRCARFLGPGRVLDLGCGVGHSYARLAPRETVGVDVASAVLVGQQRETVVADMRALPFEDGSFASVLAVQSIEHVPDPDRVLAEVTRVLRPDGVAVFVTPNRLTFGRPDEIIDPYHYTEFSAEDLAALCGPYFDRVEVHGLFGSARYAELVEEEHRRLERLLAADPLRLRRAVPRVARQRLYDLALTRARRQADPRAEAIVPEDFVLRATDLEHCLDVVGVGVGPRRR